MSVQQQPEDVPLKVSFTLAGKEQVVDNSKEVSWNQIRVYVCQQTSVRTPPTTQDEFAQKVINWITCNKHKGSAGTSAPVPATQEQVATRPHQRASSAQNDANDA